MKVEWAVRGVPVTLCDVVYDHETQTAEFGEILHNGGCICALLSADDETTLAREVYAWAAQIGQDTAAEVAYERRQASMEF